MTHTPGSNPLDNARAAKENRDLFGEVGALTEGSDSLENAPWYPARPGDIVHVHYAAIGDIPAWGETYEVTLDECLRLIHHTAPGRWVEVGAWAPGLIMDPLFELWMEAGPACVTVVRGGRVVHVGASVAPDVSPSSGSADSGPV